jgi:hypothetical protein
MENKMTVFEIHLALCIETVDIWNNPQKAFQLGYADALDDYNAILEPHALENTFPSDNEWERAISGLEWLLEEGLDLAAIISRAKELSAHPEYFDAELNAKQYAAYMNDADKSCIEYHTKKGK